MKKNYILGGIAVLAFAIIIVVIYINKKNEANNIVSVIFDEEFFIVDKNNEVDICKLDDLLASEMGLAIQFDSPNNPNCNYELNTISDNLIVSYEMFLQEDMTYTYTRNDEGKMLSCENGRQLNWIPNKKLLSDGYEEKLTLKAYKEDGKLLADETITIKVICDRVFATLN